jgi:hypothetical protein
MFVHIGGEYTILIDSIIGLVNLETVQATSSDMNRFLKTQEDENILEYVSEEIPRSLILTDDRSYVSPLSVLTLRKRIENAKIKPDTVQ